MNDTNEIEQNLKELQKENEDLKLRLSEAEEIIEALKGSDQDIAERNMTEEVLFKNEQLLKSILDNVSSGVAMIDSDGRFTVYNPQFLKLFGLSEDSTIKNVNDQNWAEWQVFNEWGNILHVNDHPVRKAALTGKRVDNQLVGVKLPSGGAITWMLISAEPIFKKNGDIENVICSYHDITEQKLAEEATKTVMELLYSALSSMTFATLLINDKEQIDVANQAFCEMFNLKESPEELLATTAREMIEKIKSTYLNPDEDLAHIEEIVARGLLVQDEEVSMKGGRIFLRDFIPLRFGANKYGRLWIHKDITARKQAGEVLAFQARLLSDVHDAVFSSDSNYNITYWNHAAEKKFGWTKEEALGKNSGELLNPIVQGSSRDLERSQLRGSGHWEGEVQFTRKDGTFIFVDLNSTVMKDANGKDMGNVVVSRDITGQKQAELALRESEQRLKFHFENSPLAVVEWDADFMVTQWSVEAERMFGWNKKEVLGKRIDTLNMIYPEDIPIVNNTMKRLTSGKENMVVSSNRNYTKTGGIIECTWYNSILFDENGKMASVMSLVQDITENKKAEGLLRASEEKLRGIMEATHESIWLFNSEGIILHANETALCRVGMTAEEIIGKPFMDSVPPEVADIRMKRLHEVVETARPVEFEDQLDGMYFLHNFYPILGITGQVTAVASYSRDITERKRSDEVIKAAREKLNMALENANVGLWEWNLNTSEVIFDERMGKMFRLTPGIFGNTYAEFENLINEEDIPHLQKAINYSLINDIQLETIFRPKSENGKTRYFSTRALVNKDKEGKPCGLIGVCFDVTGLREGSEKLVLKLNDELLRSNKELQSFAYVASHDLQEPLRMVASFTQLLSQRYKDKLDRDAQDFIRFAVDGASRMQDLINGLLDYSRIQTKGKEFSEVDMNQVMEEVNINLSLKRKEKNIQLSIDQLPVVIADEGQMVQLMQNLVGNAVKFSKNDSCVTISSNHDTQNCVISIKDEGIGIDSQYFERIFQMYQRLVPRDEYEGTGIGLAICKRIVERHGGKIWVESEVEKGSTFYFSLPVS